MRNSLSIRIDRALCVAILAATGAALVPATFPTSAERR